MNLFHRNTEEKRLVADLTRRNRDRHALADEFTRKERNRLARFTGSPATWINTANHWRRLGDKGLAVRECLAVARFKRLSGQGARLPR